MTVRTRFAPSPTGYLHIGGVRTALFNWLFARKHGGRFILRIDDTDQGRNQPEALQPILDGFKWLGLNWDEGPEVGGDYGPYFQSEKLPRYQQAVQQLLDKGLAYWDYATPEETKAEMEVAEKEKRPKIYSRRWMAATDADRRRFEAEGRKGAVKLKMPREGACRFTDHIRGEVQVEWATEQDTVIQRSDGSVTYNLANVVDDFDMRITHVIRAEEHLSNTPRQIFMLEGLGYPRPEYAHVPFVAEPGSKKKLSKREIAKYLKNPDFKKVYEPGADIKRQHIGLEVARKVKEAIEEQKKLLSDSPIPPEMSAFLDQVKQSLLLILSRLAVGLGLESGTDQQEAVARWVRDTAKQYLDNPHLLEEYGHRRHLLRDLRLELRPEMFNPVLVAFYEQVGYLPDAIINYLMLLGWSHEDGKSEDFTRQQMIGLFSLERVNKAPASLDVKKLFAFQERYMQALPVTEKVNGVMPFLRHAGLVPEGETIRPLVSRIVEAAGPRLAVFGDILDYDYLFLPNDALPSFDPVAAEKQLRAAFKGSDWTPPPLPEALRALRKLVDAADPFDAATLKSSTEEMAQSWGAKPGPLSNVLRVATTGREVGFSAYDTFAILGRDRCLARIDRALTKLS
jgi:glutamyl/glutaminyl-tRNA synthetase